MKTINTGVCLCVFFSKKRYPQSLFYALEGSTHGFKSDFTIELNTIENLIED